MWEFRRAGAGGQDDFVALAEFCEGKSHSRSDVLLDVIRVVRIHILELEEDVLCPFHEVGEYLVIEA